ncbi:MAG: T9SS type A sorting domain-containing protein [Bacteroidales bacterium]|nr:T9SS type A sorting domain-containing protein [Bacteroidales bacterium]
MNQSFHRFILLLLIFFTLFKITDSKEQVALVPLGAMPTDEPLPPDSVTAVILGPDSAMYISWLIPQTGLTVETYDIYRLSDFDPEGDPTSGTHTWYLSHNWPACSDPSWSQLDPGWYAYGVRAVYTNGQVSVMAVSNIVGHLMYCSVEVQVTLATNQPATDARVNLFGKDYPYKDYAGRDSSLVSIDSVIKSTYTVAAYHTGYDTSYHENVTISQDTLFELLLQLKKHPPYNLFVDSVSLIARWNEPTLTAVREDFENPIFPPPGWQATTTGPVGWFRTMDGSSAGFTIPPRDSYYACVNYEIFRNDAGSIHPGCCDYLITPPLDLTESDGYQLVFDSFYNGAYNHLAFIEYSYDNGKTWEPFYQLMPYSTWLTFQFDLGTFAGPNATQPVWFAFHSDNNDYWGSGWAIDNVCINDPTVPVDYENFNVYLDDSLLAQTSGLAYSYAPLNYGQRYQAAVSVNYSHGVSRKDTFSFTSRYLPIPSNLFSTVEQDSVYLSWDPPDTEFTVRAVDSIVPANLLGYNIYRNELPVGYQQHAGAYVTQTYIDAGLEPGHYRYAVSGIYDLGVYGLPGDTGESARTPFRNAIVENCKELEFTENWSFNGFIHQSWIAESPGWVIDTLEGINPPCASFLPDTAMYQYSICLVSPSLCTQEIKQREIWLDFYLQLQSSTASGTEFLRVKIWDWVSQEWFIAEEFSNADGNIPWTLFKINLTDFALENVIKLGFMAEGENAGLIDGWYIDNIYVYPVCVGPDTLHSAVDPGNAAIILTWEPPFEKLYGQWIHWDDGNLYTEFGTGGPAMFDVAHCYEPVHLIDFEDYSIHTIAFCPTEVNASYSVRVWKGKDAAILLADIPVNDPEWYQWSYVELSSPIPIDITQNLYIGYHIDALTGYPAGCDNGPAIEGYGNMINLGGWKTLTQVDPNLNVNWNIKAFIQPSDMDRGPLYYHVYRNIDNGGYELYGYAMDTTFIDANLTNALYCYRVSALWADPWMEYCESSLSAETCEILSVGLHPRPSASREFYVYPNPARKVLSVKFSGLSGCHDCSLEIFDIFGRNIDRIVEPDQKEVITIDVTNYSPGIYLVLARDGILIVGSAKFVVSK